MINITVVSGSSGLLWLYMCYTYLSRITVKSSKYAHFKCMFVWLVGLFLNTQILKVTYLLLAPRAQFLSKPYLLLLQVSLKA